MYIHICLYNDGLQFSASLYRAFFMCISTALVLGWSCWHSVIPHGIRVCGNAAESLELSVYSCNGHAVCFIWIVISSYSCIAIQSIFLYVYLHGWAASHFDDLHFIGSSLLMASRTPGSERIQSIWLLVRVSPWLGCQSFWWSAPYRQFVTYGIAHSWIRADTEYFLHVYLHGRWAASYFDDLHYDNAQWQCCIILLIITYGNAHSWIRGDRKYTILTSILAWWRQSGKKNQNR